MDCEHCGAPVRDAGTFCSHCGGRRRTEQPAPAHLSATASERFEQAEKHPGYAKACQHKPILSTAPVTGAWIAVVVSVVLLAGWVGACFYWQHLENEHYARRQVEYAEEVKQLPLREKEFYRKMGMPEDPIVRLPMVQPLEPTLDRVPMVMLRSMLPLFLLGAFAAVWWLVREQRFARAPIRHELAVVVDERVSVTSGKSRSTQYHASLHTRDGKRSEYLCDGQLAGRIATPDIGVAFLKMDHLVDFVRLEV